MTLDGTAMTDSLANSETATVEPAKKAVGTLLQTGDEATFQRLYERLAPALRAYAVRICGHSDLADDILQDLFIKYLRTPLPEMDDAATKSYLYRTATNLVTDHWRSQERERKWRWKAILRKPTEGRLKLRGDLARQFERLTPRERALLWLAHVEEFSHEEISHVLNVKPKSVKVLLFRARRKLGALLDPEGRGSK